MQTQIQTGKLNGAVLGYLRKIAEARQAAMQDETTQIDIWNIDALNARYALAGAPVLARANASKIHLS